MKKFLAILLAVMMTLGMSLSVSLAEEPARLEKADDGTIAAQAAADRIASGNAPTVVIGFLTFTGPGKGTERVAEEMSKITMEKLGVKVELHILDMASYSQQMNLMLASGEQVDLFNCVSVGFMPCVNKEYLLDLEEDGLLATYGQGIIDTFRASELNGCRVGGTLYGTPVKKDDAGGKFGISIPTMYLDAIGVDWQSMYANPDDEIIYTDFEFIEDVLGKLHAQYPDKTTFYTDPGSTVSQCLVIDAPGDQFGVMCDPVNSLEVTDLFSSQIYYDLCARFYRWNQNGWFSNDAITETNGTTTMVKAGSLCAYKTATKPGIRQQESNLCGTPVAIFQLGQDFKASNTYSTMPWAINQNTEDPIAAMQVLNLLYTDPELSTLLCWGQEGVEWVSTDDGHITFPEGVDAQNSEYYYNVNWEMPNQFIARVWEGDSLDIWTRMQNWNDNALASKAMGFTFDNTEMSTEYTALTNVYNEYHRQLELGFVNPDEGIPEFVERLKAAGLDEYIAFKQEQVNAWAAANGIQ